MEQLTAQQAKMALEYFAQQAAEDAPIITSYAGDADKHMWMTRMQASIAIERQITEQDWDALVARMSDYQSFDRDPGAYMNSLDLDDTYFNRDRERNYLEDQVSWKIDTAYACSGE